MDLVGRQIICWHSAFSNLWCVENVLYTATELTGIATEFSSERALETEKNTLNLS